MTDYDGRTRRTYRGRVATPSYAQSIRRAGVTMYVESRLRTIGGHDRGRISRCRFSQPEYSAR